MSWLRLLFALIGALILKGAPADILSSRTAQTAIDGMPSGSEKLSQGHIFRFAAEAAFAFPALDESDDLPGPRIEPGPGVYAWQFEKPLCAGERLIDRRSATLVGTVVLLV